MFWLMSKSGKLRTQNKQPHNDWYVKETLFIANRLGLGRGQETDHLLELYCPVDTVVKTVTVRAVCGYDRGVKVPSAIRKLIEEAAD